MRYQFTLAGTAINRQKIAVLVRMKRRADCHELSWESKLLQS